MKNGPHSEGYGDTSDLFIPPDGEVGHCDDDGRKLIVVERGTFIWSEPAGDDDRAVLKMYRHRSWVEPYRRGYVIRYRAQREYAALKYLTKLGIPCSVPLYWSFGYRPGHGHYEILATREIPDAAPLLSKFTSASDGLDLSPLFRYFRKMHENGLYHGALLLSNMLVTFSVDGQPSFHVIDMERTNLFPSNIVGTRVAWYDLLDMIEHIRRYRDAEYCEAPLRAYGMNDEEIARMIAHAARYRPSRETRNFFRGEFGFRCAVARWKARLNSKRNGS